MQVSGWPYMQPMQYGYTPKHPLTYKQQAARILNSQTDKIVSVWYNRGYSNIQAVSDGSGEEIFNSIFQTHAGLIPEFLALFSDETLSLQDDIWYELANYGLKHFDLNNTKRELLRQNAPYPNAADPAAVTYFHQQVGGQPHRNPSSQESAQSISQPYRPKHPNTKIDTITEVLNDQIDMLKAVWHDRGNLQAHPFSGLGAVDPGKTLFRHFFQVYCGYSANFLSLFSDTRLRPLPDDIWYELANYVLLTNRDPAKKEMLRQNAPFPSSASKEAVSFFYNSVGGQPPQAPSKSKLEAFTAKVNPQPSQGLVMHSSQLRPVESNAPAAVRPVAPAAAEKESEELKAMREMVRKMQMDKEQLQQALEAEKKQKNNALQEQLQAKPAVAQKIQSAAEDKFQCTVCMEREFSHFYNECGHKFCKICIDEWQEQNKGALTCPRCKQTSKKIQALFD